MIETSSAPTTQRTPHNKWLLLIAVYKSIQAMLFIAVGIGAMRLVGKDIGDVFEYFREALHFSPESRVINVLLDKASLINDPLLRRIGAFAFIYAGLSLAEGIGLYLEKAWGEYLTLIITASFLPWEIFEIIHKVTWLRVALLLVNILVFLYLLRVVGTRREKQAKGEVE